MPPNMPPRLDFIASSTLRTASLTAAITRSCSISMSPDFTTSGSITTPKTCFCPFILTVTLPPPDEASTVICCIFSCSFSACCRACASMSCKLNPSMKSPTFAGCNRAVRLAPFLMIDHGTNFGAKLFLHALHDGIGHGATARARAIRGASRRRCCLGRELRPSAHHLELQRLARCLEKRFLHNALGAFAESNIHHDLRHSHLHGDFVTTHAPLTRLEIVCQHLLTRVFQCSQNGIPGQVGGHLKCSVRWRVFGSNCNCNGCGRFNCAADDWRASRNT